MRTDDSALPVNEDSVFRDSKAPTKGKVAILGVLYLLLVWLPFASPDRVVDIGVTAIAAAVFFVWTLSAARVISDPANTRWRKSFILFAVAVWLITSVLLGLREVTTLLASQPDQRFFTSVTVSLGTAEVQRRQNEGWRGTITETQGFRYPMRGFVRNGKSVCLRPNGRVIRETWYSLDSLDGPIRVWGPNGEKLAEGTLEKGRMVGQFCFWGEKGGEVATASFDEDPTGIWTFRSHGVHRTVRGDEKLVRKLILDTLSIDKRKDGTYETRGWGRD